MATFNVSYSVGDWEFDCAIEAVDRADADRQAYELWLEAAHTYEQNWEVEEEE